MTSTIISDLHLEESRPEMTQLFLRFLQECTHSNHFLYILGDFFEAWIGDDDLTAYNQMIIQALKRATEQGLTIYFMHGNRDFLVGKKFLRMTGCTLLAEEHIAYFAGVPTLLMHGDTLCTEDVAYLKFRKKVRSWLFQKLVLMYSLKKRRAMAARYRAASKAHTSTAADAIMDVTPAEVVRLLNKHHVQHLIHGHTHRPGVHSFELNGLPATRTVLGAWHDVGSALICREEGGRELIVID